MHFANNTAVSAFAAYYPTVTQSFYTTVYETVLLAACETGAWMATYTVTETCRGDKTNYVTPTMPPGFIVTTVSCHSCHQHEIEITCPGAQPTGMGMPTVQIDGNGVTATITVSPTPSQTNTGVSVPTKGAVPPSNGGAVNPNRSSSGNGNESGNGNVNGNGNGNGNGCHHGAGCGNGHGHDHGKDHGNGHGNGTVGYPPVTFTGAAASIRTSLMVGAGLAFIAGPFFLL